MVMEIVFASNLLLVRSPFIFVGENGDFAPSLNLLPNSYLTRFQDLMRREASNRRGGFSFMFVVIVALLGILLGFLVKT